MTPVPLLKSFLFPGFPSSIEIGPNVVHAGEVALADLSAEIFAPPDPGVIVTLPMALLENIKRPQPKIEAGKNRLKVLHKKNIDAARISMALWVDISRKLRDESWKIQFFVRKLRVCFRSAGEFVEKTTSKAPKLHFS